MRFDEVVLERYGSFEQRALALDGPGLTVVYGPNEAGKSTCLAAIGDFLFRVPERSPRTAVFGSDALRIGATMSLADGRQISFKRRSGRGRTLIDEAGSPADDAVLGPILGTTTRDRFEHLFGLNHESLRAGGDQLLRADGEIGRLIVEAGGGLRALVGRLDAIDQEIDDLFAPRRKDSRAFYRALDVYDVADRAAKGGLLTQDAYERDRKAHMRAADTLASARERRRELTESLSRAQRAERVIPTLRTLDAVREALIAFDDLGGHEEAVARQIDEALAAHARALNGAASARGEHLELTRRLDTLRPEETWIAAEVRIRDVDGRATLVASAREGRPNRQIELSGSEAALASLRLRLKLGPEADLEPLAPPPDTLDGVRRLATAAIDRGPRLEAARAAVEGGEEAVASLRATVERGEIAGSAKPFGVDAPVFATLATDHAGVERRLSQAQAALKADEAVALGLHPGGLGQLATLICPTAADLREEIKAQTQIETELVRLKGLEAAVEGRRAAAASDIDRLRRGDEVATDELLASVRLERDRLWSAIRDAHVAGEVDRDEAERRTVAAAVDAEISHADVLADRRTAEAQRIASLLDAEQRHAVAEIELRTVGAQLRHEQEALLSRQETLARAFPKLCLRFPDTAALLAFIDARGALLGKVEVNRGIDEDAKERLAQLTPRLDQLAWAEQRLTLQPVAEASLSTRVASVVQSIGQHDAARAEHEREARDLVKQSDALALSKRQLKGLIREEADWSRAWAQAVAPLGLVADVAPADAASLATEWTGARGELRSLANTRRRITRMDEDEAELGDLVRNLSVDLGVETPQDAVAAAAMLAARWGENNKVRLRREALEPELAGLTTKVELAVSVLGAATNRLDILTATFGIEEKNYDRLEPIASRLRQREGLRREEGQLRTALRSAGDALGEVALRAQAADQDLDAVRSNLKELAASAERVDQEAEDAIRDEQRLGGALLAHDAPSTSGHAVSQRESATADMHAIVERYVELKLARSLVARAVQRVRTEQQDPLIRKAGALLAHMTLGEFESVAADVDAKGVPVVVGVRPGGSTVPVSAMSDGTRDQLFLAFRLASLANYCEATEPLPFIADDILVHFDDPRGAATLELLAEFCASTQVLLFTHHVSVRDAASKLVASGRANIVSLDRPDLRQRGDLPQRAC